MSTIGSISTRTTTLLSSNRLLSALRRTQAEMLASQNQISSGKTVLKPSDAPAKVAAILLVQRQLAAREQSDRNLQHASAILDNTDQALKDATDLLIDARSVASSQVGVGSNTDTRRNQAAVVDAQVQSLIDIANRKFQDISLFGGAHNPAANQGVFVSAFGGVRYTGTRTNLAGDVGLRDPLSYNTNGIDAFNALSSRVKSLIDLDPQATADTRLQDIRGAQGEGFQKGSVVVTIDGSDVAVDLTDAQTLGDVVTRVNDAIGKIDGAAGSLAIAGSGFALTAATGHTIAIGETSDGRSAADLGLKLTATDATVAGGDLDPRLTMATSLAALGVSVDWTSGISITQGNQTKVLDLGSARTVQDLVNAVDKLDLGLRLEINDDATSLNLSSEVSGVELSIGENGGSTASDLGLRTLDLGTSLADFNNGLGVSNPPGDDFQIQLHNGATFRVNIDAASNVGDVIAAIRTAATTAGLRVGAPGAAGTDLNIGLASTGNGLALEDGTSGAAEFKVVQLGESLAADNLGIYTNAGSGSTIQGKDNSKVQVDSVFSHLIALRNSLEGDDARGITLAGGALEKDIDTLARVRADIGVRAQRVQQQQQRSADLKITEQSMLSDLQDSDLSAVITKFTQLQQQMEASLKVGAQMLQQSLMDFLR